MKTLKLKNKNQSQEMKDKTLYQKISASAVTLLISEELNHDQLNSVDIRNEGFGLEWRDECPSGHLRVGDRALELNKLDVFKMTNKENQMYYILLIFLLSINEIYFRMKTLNMNILILIEMISWQHFARRD